MLGFIIFELSVLAVLWTAFIVMMSIRRLGGRIRIIKWWKSSVSTQLVIISLLGMIEALSLIALGTDHTPPLWVYAVIFGAIDVFVARWLLLAWRARKTPPSDRD